MKQREDNYIESDEESEVGHVDTRCFDCCENPDPALGCDLHIDVAG